LNYIGEKEENKEKKMNDKEKILDALEGKEEWEMTKERELAGEILDVFEDFLADKNINIPNKERDEYECDEDEKAILFGSEYYWLEDKITEMIKKYKNGRES
jgi:hypothetical protein